MSEVLGVDRLVVDELGLGQDAAAECAMMFDLVSSRPMAKTLALTNAKWDKLKERLGERTWSRMRGLATFVMLADKDLRQEPPEAAADDILADLEGLAEPLRGSERALLVRASGRGLDALAAHERAVVEKLLARGFALDAHLDEVLGRMGRARNARTT